MNAPPIPATPSGAGLLEELHAALTRYVIFPNAEAADAVTLWVAATHAQPAWEHAPRLAVVSPLKRCGQESPAGCGRRDLLWAAHHRERHHRRGGPLYRRRPPHPAGR